jgi:PleD family two-component response regulator
MTQEDPPDLVVLDIRLPDIDGYEVCRRMRAHRRTQEVPIIFLTEKRDRVDKLTGLELGVVDYITKPFDIQELRLRVRNALRRATQMSLVNPVTSLPEGPVVDERLSSTLTSDRQWCIMMITILGLDRFRELYGFVASDDVLRAVSLMMSNAVRDVGGEDDFIGHLAPHDFIVITTEEHIAPIRERVDLRLKQSMEYFYPLKDRAKAKQAMAENRLKLEIGQVSRGNGPFADLETLKSAVLTSREKSS